MLILIMKLTHRQYISTYLNNSVIILSIIIKIKSTPEHFDSFESAFLQLNTKYLISFKSFVVKSN